MPPVVKFIITQASESGCDYEKVLPGVMFISLVLLWYQLVTRKMYDLFSKEGAKKVNFRASCN